MRKGGVLSLLGISLLCNNKQLEHFLRLVVHSGVKYRCMESGRYNIYLVALMVLSY